MRSKQVLYLYFVERNKHTKISAMTLNIYHTADLNLDASEGKYTVMCEESGVNVQFRNLRDLKRFCKNDPHNAMDWEA